MKKVILLMIFFFYLTVNHKNIVGGETYSQTSAVNMAPFSSVAFDKETLKDIRIASVTKTDCLNNYDFTNCNLPIEVKASFKNILAIDPSQSFNSKPKITPILITRKQQTESSNMTTKQTVPSKLFNTFELTQREEQDKRTITLEKYLEKHNSPLVPFAKDFVYWADYYEIDWRLVPAITGVESTFGKRIPKNSYNAYGWNNGNYKFSSWPASIEHVTKTLREKYINKNADSIDKIARRYAPPSTTWARNVKFFMNKIDSSPIASNF